MRSARPGKKPYALALLDMAQRQTKPSPLCSSFAKSCAEERVRAILRFRRLPVWTGALTAVLFLLAAGVLATQAQTAARVPEAPAAMQKQAETPEAPVNQPVIHIDPVITPAPAAQEPGSRSPRLRLAAGGRGRSRDGCVWLDSPPADAEGIVSQRR